MRMMTSCQKIDLATMMACGCGGRRQFIPLGHFSNTVCKFGSTRSYGGGNLVGSCKVVPTKSKEISLVNGIGQAKTVTFDLRQESKKPISLANLSELVANDLQKKHTVHENGFPVKGGGKNGDVYISIT